MDNLSKQILEFSKNIMNCSIKHSFKKPFENTTSARCIEVPWVASQIRKLKCNSILDIGFSLSSLDYLGLLIELKRKYNKKIKAVDIINPKKVERRYPNEWLKDIYSIPVFIGDIREISIPGQYDVVTCISVIEHIGYDKPSIDDFNTAFARATNIEDIIWERPFDTNKRVLDSIYHVLKDNGILLLTVPMGKGGPVLLQDSLGYYCVQYEYEKETWQEIITHSGYHILEQFFFKLTSNYEWIQVKRVLDLSTQKAIQKSHSKGCALAVLQKKQNNRVFKGAL